MQIVALHPTFSAARSLTCLHLQVQCSETLLAHLLRLVPALEELWLGLANPHMLSKAFFLAFVSGGPGVSTALTPPDQTSGPICGGLKRLHVHYKRWLRGIEKTAVISALSTIVASRQQEEPGFLLFLSIDEGPKGQVWQVHEPVEAIDMPNSDCYIFIGIPSAHGIIPLSATLSPNDFISPPFRELAYLVISSHGSSYLPIDFLFPFHGLVELRVASLLQPNTQLPDNLPFFHTLEILDVDSIQSSLLVSQIFHKLERYWESSEDDKHNQIQNTLTEMPLCTRLHLPLSRLMTFKLPRICELSVELNHSEPNMVWQKHVAVNANLSGLKLLHIRDWFSETHLGQLIQIFKSLPALETLIVQHGTYLDVDFFKAFAPMDIQNTFGLNQLGVEGQIAELICPKLESFQIEDVDLRQLMQFVDLQDIVTLRAAIGSPLKHFTFYHWLPPKKWELIGGDGSFTVEEVVPAQTFKLDI